MKLSQSSLVLVEKAVRKAIAKYADGSEQTIVTDIHLQPNQGSGELVIFDDDDRLLASALIEEWASYEGDDFYGETERILTDLLVRLKSEGVLDKLSILKPFSFVLVDESKETVADLLLIDDDTLLLTDDLLKGLDEELDAFLKELLEK